MAANDPKQTVENTMKNTDWKATAELIGIAAVVASLIFVGLQLRQEQDIAIAQIFADHDDTQIEWARLISENNEVWVKGLKAEPLSDSEQAIYFSLCAAFFHKENDRYRRALLISGIPPTAITVDFAHMIYTYPALEEAWHTYREATDKIYDVAYLRQFDEGVLSALDDIEAGRVEHIKEFPFAPN